MFIKLSICTFLCLAIVSSFEIRGVLQKFVRPLAPFLPKTENEPDTSANSVDAREHGSLDFLGRDIVRVASKKIKEIREDLKTSFSKTTQGLDCNRTFSNDVNNFKSQLKAIYPGTKWCGDGNVSESYDDLGKFSSTDSCCREHDLCPNNIAADSTKYGLINSGLFTRSHCDCDVKFYNCLKEAKSFVADSIGYTYFTILGPQCFKEDYPAVGCVQVKGGKCIQYSFDTGRDKVYQWFDSPPF